MLDDRDRGAIRRKFGDQLEGCIAIREIVVAQFLALNLLGPDNAGAGMIAELIKCGLLMRVFPVTQRLPERAGYRECGKRGFRRLRREPRGDRRVIGCCPRESLGREPAARRQRRRSRLA